MSKCRYLLTIFLIFILSALVHATHNRAGEITYKRIAPFTKVVNGVNVPNYFYLITVTKYTDDGQGIADRCVDTVYFGDGERGIAPRVNGFPTTPTCGCGSFGGQQVGCGEGIVNASGYVVKVNTYTITHTYAGPGSYLIRTFDPNRNQGVHNIPNSVNTPFFVESLLIINGFTGANSSPIFTFPPIDRACRGKCFEHNPGAFDPDDDSLSFEITKSRGYMGQPVPGYSFPEVQPGGTFGIHPRTGLLSWCNPQLQDEYNLAFIVKEWRKNTEGIYQLIGYVLRDMQVIVADCPTNDPPVVQVPADTCVEAGALIEKTLFVSDRNGDRVDIIGGGGPFTSVAPVAMINVSSGTTTPNGPGFPVKFTWQTSCEHIRQQEYLATFKAIDDGKPVKLASFNSFGIHVLPPSVKNVTAVPVGSAIRVLWDQPVCNPKTNPVTGYRIFRRNDCATITPVACRTGVDPSSGFVLVGETPVNVHTFTDDNNGDGLVVGENYSYVVIAVYSDGTVTFASRAVCAKLRRDVPILLNVDVDVTAESGTMLVKWTRPLKTEGNFDTLAIPGPYKFILTHHSSQGKITEVFTSTRDFMYQLDTSFTHTGLNTTLGSEEYVVQFMAGTLTIGSSQRATSVFLKATPSDRLVQLEWSARTPWKNLTYKVLRKGPSEATFTPIATVTSPSYIDSVKVFNLQSYCYQVEASGEYSDPNIYKPLVNRSQQVCTVPADILPPDTPTLTVEADCPAGMVNVAWDMVSRKYPNDDVKEFVLFHKPTVTGEYIQVASGSINSKTFENMEEVSGCYAVQAVDSTGNRSKFSTDVCIDNCPEFELPNLFTPNGDGVNEYYKAIKVRQIREIGLVIVDRWGHTVYRTKDPYFQWNGISQASKALVDEGTYFFVCDVFEPRLKGVVKRTIKGYLQVVR